MAEQNIKNEAIEKFNALKGEVTTMIKNDITDAKELLKKNI